MDQLPIDADDVIDQFITVYSIWLNELIYSLNAPDVSVDSMLEQVFMIHDRWKHHPSYMHIVNHTVHPKLIRMVKQGRYK